MVHLDKLYCLCVTMCKLLFDLKESVNVEVHLAHTAFDSCVSAREAW